MCTSLCRRSELEAAGEIDWVEDRQPYPRGQVQRHAQADAPHAQSPTVTHLICTQGPTPNCRMIGLKIEVRWRYTHKVTGKPVYIWCDAEITQVLSRLLSHPPAYVVTICIHDRCTAG